MQFITRRFEILKQDPYLTNNYIRIKIIGWSERSFNFESNEFSSYEEHIIPKDSILVQSPNESDYDDNHD